MPSQMLGNIGEIEVMPSERNEQLRATFTFFGQNGTKQEQQQNRAPNLWIPIKHDTGHVNLFTHR